MSDFFPNGTGGRKGPPIHQAVVGWAARLGRTAEHMQDTCMHTAGCTRNKGNNHICSGSVRGKIPPLFGADFRAWHAQRVCRNPNCPASIPEFVYKVDTVVVGKDAEGKKIVAYRYTERKDPDFYLKWSKDGQRRCQNCMRYYDKRADREDILDADKERTKTVCMDNYGERLREQLYVERVFVLDIEVLQFFGLPSIPPLTSDSDAGGAMPGSGESGSGAAGSGAAGSGESGSGESGSGESDAGDSDAGGAMSGSGAAGSGDTGDAGYEFWYDSDLCRSWPSSGSDFTE